MLAGYQTPPELKIYVNDKIINEANPNPQESLISLLRRKGFTGVKLGCSEGGCGSCTVLVTFWDYKQLKPVSLSINSCLAPALSMHMKHVLTVEGLTKDGVLHETQKAVANANGSQCGFCTPGIVMSLFAEVTTNPHPTKHSIEDAFDGNLCRCTGYRPILDGAKSLACAGECKTCPAKVTCSDIEDFGKVNHYDFPLELLKYHQELKSPISYVFRNSAGFQFVHPSSKTELVHLFNQFPYAKIINGNTEVGIETRFKNLNYPILINSFDIFDMKQMEIKDIGVEFGALTTVAMFQSRLSELVENLPEEKTRGFCAILDNIKYFAGRQIRNVSAISGNICTASPISDLNPVLVALGAILTMESVNGGIRKMPIAEFFLGYRQTALKQGEVLISVFLPFTTPNQYASAFKQAKRRDDDIAIVNAGFLIELESSGPQMIVKNSSFAFGGMGAFTMTAKKTSEYLKGKVWCDELVENCYPLLLQDLPLSATSPGGQIEFRKSLAQSFMLKFSLRVKDALSKQGHTQYTLDDKYVSALEEIPREISHGEQVYQTSKGTGSVGKPIVHLSAVKQVTGEAVYVDDLPKFHNEMYAIVVGSTVAHGYIESIDTSMAEKAPGFIGWVSKKDCPPADDHGDPNMIGPVFHDEELFATSEVHCIGQMIGLVLAETEAEARYAAKLVKVSYKKLPAIFTIEDAIKSDSYFSGMRKIETGEYKPGDPKPDLPLSAATHFVEGVARMSAQEHFYLETNASLCVPQEDGEMEIYASTQQAKETQDFAAHILQVPYHKVVVRIKRLGGGFGGKESRSVFLSTGLALAAKMYKRPVRSMLSREEDMVVSGTRHPFRGEYKVGFTNEGRLVSLELNMYANAGYSADLSWAVLERSMTHCDNAYKIPNVKLHGKLCKTNTATNTAFRGFGGPQGMMVAEQYISHVATHLNLPVEHVRRINLYKDGDKTHFDMPLENVFLDRAWNELMESSQFQERKLKVAKFNESHKYRKRGITFMPTKFGLAFTARHLNQAAALVHVYTDGSVRISHGGTEMGQGLHTKMVQVTADAFQIPIEMVYLSETRTDIVINASATAASVSSDINGMALKNACDQILERLKPIREHNPNLTWPQLVKKAYFERVNLSANGFYKTPDLTFDWSTCKGRMFSYFTYGVACTEVEIDTLTGDHVVLSSHLIMDIGTPINPTIDIGQIEGAFTQGQGWCTIEEPLVSPSTGFLLTRGPGLYKIPGFKDIPVDFRVTVMDGVRNTRAIHSSKAVGEPPFFLGASVFFAIRDAISAARADLGTPGYYRLDCPATSERIRLACKDEFVERSATPLKEGELCWGVPL